MSELPDVISKAIFEYLDQRKAPDVRSESPPYCFNEDKEALTLHVDGMIGCKHLAAYITAHLWGVVGPP